MAFEHVLAALGAGLEGGVRGYRMGKDIQDDEARAREEKLRYEQEQARLRDDTTYSRHRDTLNDQERRNTKGEAEMRRLEQKAAAQAVVDSLPKGSLARQAAEAAMAGLSGLGPSMEKDAAKAEALTRHDTIEGTLPDHLRASYHTSGHTQEYQPDDYLTDAQKLTRKRGELGATADSQIRVSTSVHATNAALDRQNAANPVRPTDDPALPNGVRQWLSTLPAKAGGDYRKTVKEFQQGWAGQVGVHPRASSAAARQYLDSLFAASDIPPAQKPTDYGFGPDDTTADDTTTDTTAPPPPPPPPPAGGSIPVTARPPAGATAGPQGPPPPAANPRLEAQAAAVLEAFRAEQNPARKAILRQKLEELKRSAVGQPPARRQAVPAAPPSSAPWNR